MISVEEAVARIAAIVRPLPFATAPLADALHRFASNDVLSPLNLPPFDNSAMDGYAVRAQDLIAASSENPKTLKMRARLPAGEASAETVSEGTCIRVFTGSRIPTGADAVVMQEDVEASADQITS